MLERRNPSHGPLGVKPSILTICSSGFCLQSGAEWALPLETDAAWGSRRPHELRYSSRTQESPGPPSLLPWPWGWLLCTSTQSLQEAGASPGMRGNSWRGAPHIGLTFLGHRGGERPSVPQSGFQKTDWLGQKGCQAPAHAEQGPWTKALCTRQHCLVSLTASRRLRKAEVQGTSPVTP